MKKLFLTAAALTMICMLVSFTSHSDAQRREPYSKPSIGSREGGSNNRDSGKDQTGPASRTQGGHIVVSRTSSSIFPSPSTVCGSQCQSDSTSRTGYSHLCCYPPGRPRPDGGPVPILCFHRPCYPPAWGIYLTRQVFGPYAGKYVGTVSLTVGTLVGVNNPSGYWITLDDPGLTSHGCSINAVTLPPFGTITGAQIARLYGPNHPLPVTFVACNVIGSPLPQAVPIIIIYSLPGASTPKAD